MVLRKESGDHEIRAFLQETASRSRENTELEAGPLGRVPMGMFVYIGPAQPEAAVGDTLVFLDRCFELRRAEPVVVEGRKAYCWGLCVEKGSDTAWGS